MRLPVTSAALAAAFVLTPLAAGYAPAMSQDFSITNQVAPANGSNRDVMRQLQAWWDLHGYYPRHASNNDEGGIVKLHLLIHSDGRIWMADVAQSSGSSSLDTAAVSTFRSGFVRPFPEGAPAITIDLSLHYVLAHRHDQPVAANYTSTPSKAPFTITNDPVKSPILETMTLRTCTGKVVKQGVRNHPAYGIPYFAEAIFFRRPDGTPWVKFYEGGYSILAPVTEVGKVVQWTGREERLKGGVSQFYQYTVWPEGDNQLNGNISTDIANDNININRGGTVDLSCATDHVTAVEWNAMYVNKILSPEGDPP